MADMLRRRRILQREAELTEEQRIDDRAAAKRQRRVERLLAAEAYERNCMYGEDVWSREAEKRAAEGVRERREQGDMFMCEGTEWSGADGGWMGWVGGWDACHLVFVLAGFYAPCSLVPSSY